MYAQWALVGGLSLAREQESDTIIFMADGPGEDLAEREACYGDEETIVKWCEIYVVGSCSGILGNFRKK